MNVNWSDPQDLLALLIVGGVILAICIGGWRIITAIFGFGRTARGQVQGVGNSVKSLGTGWKEVLAGAVGICIGAFLLSSVDSGTQGAGWGFLLGGLLLFGIGAKTGGT